VIEDGTFENCSSLETVSIPSSLETLAGQLFGQLGNVAIMIIETGAMVSEAVLRTEATPSQVATSEEESGSSDCDI
jgi:hypothetical protein